MGPLPNGVFMAFLNGGDPNYLLTGMILQVHHVNYHRENGGSSLGWMVPLLINPIYTLHSGYLLGISPFKGLREALNS